MTAKIIPLRPPEPPPNKLSDEALIAACAVRDEAALRALFRRHHLGLYRFVSRLMGPSAHDVDDLVQQTFLTAWQNADKFRGQSKVSSWLFGIAANLARQQRRKEQRRRGLFEVFASSSPEPPVATEELLSRKQLVKKLMHTLDTLPHDLRVAYVMCEIEEVAGTEAAKVLGIRPGTLWRRLHDARRRLRTELAKEVS